MSENDPRPIDHLTREEMEARRLKAAGDLLRGVSQAEVARIYGISRTTTSRWYRALKDAGPKGLKRRIATGRPARLTTVQFAEIAKTFMQNPGSIVRTAVTGKTRITSVLLRDYIEKQYGVSYDTDHVSRMIAKIKRAGKL